MKRPRQELATPQPKVDGMPLPDLLLLSHWRNAAAAAAINQGNDKPSCSSALTSKSAMRALFQHAGTAASDDCLLESTAPSNWLGTITDSQFFRRFSLSCEVECTEPDELICPREAVVVHKPDVKLEKESPTSLSSPVSAQCPAAAATDCIREPKLAHVVGKKPTEARRPKWGRRISMDDGLLDDDSDDVKELLADPSAITTAEGQADARSNADGEKVVGRSEATNWREVLLPGHQPNSSMNGGPVAISSLPSDAQKREAALVALITRVTQDYVKQFSSSSNPAEVPLLVTEVFKYAREVLAILGRSPCAAGTTTAFPSSSRLPWPLKYPAGHFSCSFFAKELNRMKKWLRTWRLADGETDPAAAPRDDLGSSPGTTSDGGGSSPASAVDSAIFGDETFIVDDRGHRASLRIARKEAAKRAEDEMEEHRRQQQRGYFSNDCSAVGRTSADGGEGSLSNIAVLSGPCGAGKTAVVYAAAQAMGYRVVEINTSVKRCPRAIERIFREAAQSKQIRVRSEFTAARAQLDRWRIEAEETAAALRAAADAEQQRQKGVEEAEERNRRREQEENQAASLVGVSSKKKKVAAPGAAAAPPPPPQARPVKAQSKKINAISKDAMTKFFAPRPKSSPSSSSNALLIDVDAVTDAPDPSNVKLGKAETVPPSPRDISSIPLDTEDEAKTPGKQRTSHISVIPFVEDSRKRQRDSNDEAEGSKKTSDKEQLLQQQQQQPPLANDARCFPLSPTQPASAVGGICLSSLTPQTKASLSSPIVMVDDDTTPSRVGAAGGSALLPLILLESADVFLPDEQARPFYNSIRKLAAESKFPILVTANEMSAQQAGNFFGAGTPQAEALPAPAVVMALEVLVIVLAERKYITLRDTHVVAEDEGTDALILGLSKQVRDFMTVAESRRPGDARSCLLDAQFFFQSGVALHADDAGEEEEEQQQQRLRVAAAQVFFGSHEMCSLRRRLQAVRRSQLFARTPLPAVVMDDDSDSENDGQDFDGPSTTGRPAADADATTAAASLHDAQVVSAESPPEDERSIRARMCERVGQAVQVPHRNKGQFARARAVSSGSSLLDFMFGPWCKETKGAAAT